MKSIWLTAAAAAALSTGAFAQSGADHSQHTAAQHAAATAQPAAAALDAERYGTWGFDLSARNPAVKPGDDFFQFTQGAALGRLEIPADRSRYGSFDKLSELSEARVRAVLEAASANASATGEEAQIGAFYKSYMDEAKINALGTAPLTQRLGAIKAANDRVKLAALMGGSNKDMQSSLFGVFIGADAKSPNKYAVYLSHAGIGLPDRDYYLDAKYDAQRKAYEAYIVQMLTLAGWADPAGSAKAIQAVETRVAEVHWTRADRRDDDKTYNPMTLAQLQAAAPGFDWKAFMAVADLGSVDRVIVSENTAFPKMAKIYAETPVAVLQAWAAFHLADNAAPYLPATFVDAQFAFRGKTLSGQPEIRPRWKRAAGLTNGLMGEAVGKVYVARYFTPEAKAKMDELVANLRAAMKVRIENLTWMSPATKAQALKKLAAFNVKIGYPSKWRDYSALTVRADDLVGNVERGSAFEWNRVVSRLNQPVDRDEWEMSPQMVNAYYMPPLNEIVFPAAILQPPFFDPNADPAINYGGIGGVIGHEISHGFDDQGRKWAADGSLSDWWTAEDAAKFEAQTKVLGAQYDAFEPLPGHHVQGALTMGENIGDLAGLTIALEAYKASLGGKPSPVIDGLTGEQRVFLGWAQVWRSKTRDAEAIRRLATDPHSPPEYRVNGTVRNIDAWYDAFGVKPGDKLYIPPEQRVKLW